MPSKSSITLALTIAGFFGFALLLPAAVVLGWHLWPSRRAARAAAAAIKHSKLMSGEMAETMIPAVCYEHDVEMGKPEGKRRAREVKVRYVEGCADEKGMNWEGEGIVMLREMKEWFVERRAVRKQEKKAQKAQKEVEKMDSAVVVEEVVVEKLATPAPAVRRADRPWGSV